MRKSRWKSLSPGRVLVSDFTTFANRLPLIPLLREFDLPELDKLRRKVRPRISWTAMMMKAYATVARHRPELRQIYMSRPYAHIYEHPSSIAQLTITREVEGETQLCFARFCEPDNCSLIYLQRRYEFFRRAPIEDIKQFRHQIRFASLPSLIRKPLWRLLTNWWGSRRAVNIGTFGMSLSQGMYETKGTFHLGPMTTIIGYELLPKQGKSRITMTFDHRVLDGAVATDILEEVCQTLRSNIATELKKLALRPNNASPQSMQKNQNGISGKRDSCQPNLVLPSFDREAA